MEKENTKTEGFDINRSRISNNKMATFLVGDVVDDITSVPGIGPGTQEKLKTQGVETTIQLLGIFFTMKGLGMNQTQHCDAMWYYLQELGINAFRSGIVHAIAEKSNIMIPGIYENLDD